MSRAVAMALRSVAVLIALLAAIDPSVTSLRTARPTIAVLTLDAAQDGARADTVARLLARNARVLQAPFPAADATVLVGRNLPPSLPEGDAPVFAVRPDLAASAVHVLRVDVPATVSLQASVDVRASVRVTHGAVAAGTAAETRPTATSSASRLVLTLRSGSAVLDQRTIGLTARDTTLEVALVFVPVVTGAVPLRVEAEIKSDGRGQRSATTIAAADALIAVEDRAWRVLVYDSRPSWMSTFVRRAIERDPRFIVTSRIVTSRAISTSAGAAPATLAGADALDAFDVVIVGAPDALSQRDVAGLDRFLRQRGGSAVLLFDSGERGFTDRLTGSARWRLRTLPAAIALQAAPPEPTASPAVTAPLLAMQLFAPLTLPPGASARVGSADGTSVVWQTTVGTGQLLVSGALDAWRFRDPSTSAFDRTWQQLVGDAALAAVPPVVVAVAPQVAHSVDSVQVRVVVRDAALRDLPTADGSTDTGDRAAPRAETRTETRAAVRAALEWSAMDSTRRMPFRLWPDGAPGSLRGTIHLPTDLAVASETAPVDARVIVWVDDRRSETPLRIDRRRQIAGPDGRDLLERFATGRGGTVEPMSRLSVLADSMRRIVRTAPAPERWYPMRSPWWIVPFALALGAEWWFRRRRGLP